MKARAAIIGEASSSSHHGEFPLLYAGQPLLRIPFAAVILADTVHGAPHVLRELIKRWGVLHEIVVIVTVRQVAPCC